MLADADGNLTVANTKMLPYACAAVAFSGLVYLVASLLISTFGIRRIMRFFPPVVTGPIIISIPFMADCPADVVLIDAFENTVKFGNALFRLSDFTPALLGLFFGFLETLLFRRFLKCHSIVKEQCRHIENPLQHEQFQRFFPNKVHGAITRITLIPGATIAVLLRCHVFAGGEMQLASTVGAIQQAGKQPLPLGLLGRAAFVLP